MNQLENLSKKILIVSGGMLEDSFVGELLEREAYDWMIACDRGMEFFYRNGLEPDLILGDFDSANPDVRDYFSKRPVEMRQYPEQKDWTDTELAIRLALLQKPEEIHLLGATGGRLDHLLGNIGLLELGLEAAVQIFLMDPSNRLRLIDKPMCLTREEQFGDYLSLVPWAGEVSGLTLTGMKYPLENATLTASATLGISNEILEERASIRFTSGKLLVFETRDKKEKS
jgi:thiamine pyrophosphokinase